MSSRDPQLSTFPQIVLSYSDSVAKEIIQLSTLSCTDSTIFTLKCLSIGTPKAINFPFVSNEKSMIFMCPSIQAHYNEAVIYLNFGTPKNNEFSIWNIWKIYYF